MGDDVLPRRCMDSILVNDRPQTHEDACKAGKESHMICGSVAGQTLGAFPVSLGQDNGMRVVDSTVEEVENIAAEDGREGHDSPVLRKAADAKCVCD